MAGSSQAHPVATVAEGLYLSSFAENFLRARGAEEASARAAGAEARDIFSTQRYLDELGRERRAEDLLGQVIAARRAQQAAPVALPAQPAVPTVVPPPGPGPAFAPDMPLAPGAPPLFRVPGPAPVAPAAVSPLAAGGAAALRQPRPPVIESLLGHLDPAAQARLLTSRTGRLALPTLEDAERERRLEEDRTEAEDLFGRAQAAFRADPGDPTGLDMLAAGFRRIGRHGEAAQWMQLSAKTRADKEEAKRFAADGQNFLAALDAYDKEPTAENLAKVRQANADVQSLGWRKVATALIENRLKHALSPDRDEEAFLRAALTSKEKDPAKAWAEAAAQNPDGLAKVWMRRILSGKEELPEELRDLLRVGPALPPRDAALTTRARFLAEQEAQAARRAGAPWTPVQLMRRWEDKIQELITQEREAKLKAGRQDLEQMTLAELTLLAQRESTRLERSDRAGAPEEELRDIRDTLRVLNDAITKKRGAPLEQSGPGAVGADPRRAVTPPARATAAEAQAEVRRLVSQGHTTKSAVAAMRAKGWPATYSAADVP